MKKITKKILASTLALAMTVAGSVVTFADEASVMPTPEAKVEYSGDTVTITVSASGDFKKGFDYGIAYDAEKVKVKSAATSKEFDDFVTKCSGTKTPGTVKDLAYVVMGGAISDTDPVTEEPNDTNYSGVIGTATFTLLDGVKAEDAKFVVVAESAKMNDVIKGSGSGKTLLQAVTDGDIKDDTVPGVKVPAPVAPTPAGGEETDAPEQPSDQPSQQPGGDNTQQPGGNDQNPGGNQPQQPGGEQPKNDNKTQAPAAAATTPAAKTNTKKAPGTGDAGVVLPIVAICGAAAAVAVASKKKVED